MEKLENEVLSVETFIPERMCEIECERIRERKREREKVPIARESL